MTKKEFISLCSFHIYSGYNLTRIRHNVIYFDWKETEQGTGFKYAVALNSVNGTKADLIRAMYNWIFRGINLPANVRYRYAETDSQRFKTNLSLNW